MMTTTTPTPAASAKNALGRKIAGALAIAFGVMTIIEGGALIFGGPEALAAAGKIVPFVLFFNFGAGFLYVMTGVGTIARHTPALMFARVLAVSSIAVLIALIVYILAGEPYEPRTLVVMIVRSAFWTAQALLLPRLFAGATPAQSCRH